METPLPVAPPSPRRLGFRLGILAAVVVALYAALGFFAGVGPFLDALARMRPAPLLLALALVVAVYAVRSFRWRLYLGRMGVLAPQGPFGFTSAFAMGLPQGKWGQVVKAWILRGRTGLPYDRILPGVFAERLAEVTGGLLHLAVGVAVVPSGDPRLLLVSVILLVAGLTAARLRPFARLVLRASAWIPWVRRHRTPLREGYLGLRRHLHPAELLPPAVMGLSGFLLESLALWAIVTPGLGLDVGVGEAILILAIVDIVGTVTFLPGGLVATEGSLLVLLSLEGVPLPEAAAATLLFRAVTLWFGIGLGLLGVGFLTMASNRRRERPSRGI